MTCRVFCYRPRGGVVWTFSRGEQVRRRVVEVSENVNNRFLEKRQEEEGRVMVTGKKAKMICPRERLNLDRWNSIIVEKGETAPCGHLEIRDCTQERKRIQYFLFSRAQKRVKASPRPSWSPLPL